MRNLSNPMRASLLAPQTEETYLVLITLSHPDIAQPIRATSDNVATISRGDTFSPYPFELTLPDDQDNSSPRAQLTIDNIDRSIVLAVRDIRSPLEVLIEIVRAADLDTVEAQFVQFKLVNVTYDELIVRGDLTIEDFTTEPYPAGLFTPAGFPGLF